MSSDWTAIPAVAEAARSGEFGRILRTARVARGLTLEEAAALAGVSVSTLSRMETKPGRAWDTRELRRLAELFTIPAHLFGLSPSTFDAHPASLGTDVDEEADRMRRRDLLATTAAAMAGSLLPGGTGRVDATGATDTIQDVLFGRVTAAPIAGQQLAAQLAAARAEFRATRYSQLTRRLPRLLATATANRQVANVGEASLAADRQAQAYNLATQLLLKLHEDGMAWATADRAVQAATSGTDPLILAEARRQAATVMRRTRHHSSSQKLMLDAAGTLRADTGLADQASSADYAQLLAAAAYTAADRDDRDDAWALLQGAETAALAAGLTGGNRFNLVDLAVYKISVARVLGDYGVATDYARQVDPTQIPSLERRARYWEDAALAYYGRGRPQAAFQALLAAEQDTPQEVRLRPWAQQLTHDLLRGNHRHSLSGVHEFATRVGAIAS